MVTAPGYEDFTKNFTLNSTSCVSEDLLRDVPLHEAHTINVKMLPEGLRVPLPFSSSFKPASPSRSKVFYPDQINPYQEEMKTVSPSRKRPKRPFNLKSRKNSKIPSNRPSVFKQSNTLGGRKNTTPRPTPRPRRRRRRPVNKGKNSTPKSPIGLRDDGLDGILEIRDAFVDEDEYEYYYEDEIERC